MFSFDPPATAPAWAPPADLVDRLARATTQTWAAPETVDLGIGQPDSTLLPLDVFRRAFAAAPLDDPAPLQYGHPYGDGFLRLALAEFLTGAYGIAVDPEATVITNGNSHAIDLVCTVLTSPGDVVVVEEPTYFLALDIFRKHGLRLVGVPVDDDGMDVEALEAALREHRPAFVYTIPTFHNPTGVTMSAERRARLVALAEEHGTVVVADEVYHLLGFDGSVAPRPLPVAAAAASGRVLSLGTFSKILAPGLRLGWVQGSPALVEQLAYAPVVVSGGGFGPFTGGVVRRIVESGELDRHLARTRSVLASRAAVLHAALAAHLPEAEVRPAGGGYFAWLRLPGETDTFRWWRAAGAHQVGYRPGVLFSTRGAQVDRVRLSWAFYEAERIEPAVATLAAIFRDRLTAG